MKFIDLHCDTLLKALRDGVRDLYQLPDAMAGADKLETGGCLAQCFAIFLPPKGRPGMPEDETLIAEAAAILDNTLRQHPDRIAQARCAADIQANDAAGKVSAILTMEDGRAVEGKMENLERFYAMGVRMLSLTWNSANCFGAANSKDPAEMAKGLTPFGKEAIERMNELGMAVDVSHLADGGFWDVAEISRVPFLATHSNCRSLCPHQRNLTDEMIRRLADKGGISGVNFYGAFLNADVADERSTAAMIARHARHLANVGGVDCVALGSDFDGISGQLEVDGADKMPLVFDALAKEGFTESEIEKVAWRNAMRFIGDVLK